MWIILYWADGTWCTSEELGEYMHMSDDYARVALPDWMNAEQIELVVQMLLA